MLQWLKGGMSRYSPIFVCNKIVHYILITLLACYIQTHFGWIRSGGMALIVLAMILITISIQIVIRVLNISDALHVLLVTK